MEWLLIMIGASLKTQMDLSFFKITFLVFMGGQENIKLLLSITGKNDMRHYEK